MVHYIGNKKIGLIQCNNIKVKQQQHVVMNVDHDNAYHDNNSMYDTIICIFLFQIVMVLSNMECFALQKEEDCM